MFIANQQHGIYTTNQGVYPTDLEAVHIADNIIIKNGGAGVYLYHPDADELHLADRRQIIVNNNQIEANHQGIFIERSTTDQASILDEVTGNIVQS